MRTRSKPAPPLNNRRAERLANITAERLNRRINALPLWARDFIHMLETRVDPQGDIAELVYLRDQNRALIKVVGELKAENRRLAKKTTGS